MNLKFNDLKIYLNGKYEIFEYKDLNKDSSHSERVSLKRELEIVRNGSNFQIARIQPGKNCVEIYVYKENTIKGEKK